MKEEVAKLMKEKAGDGSGQRRQLMRLLPSDPDLVRVASLPKIPGKQTLYPKRSYLDQ